MNDVDRALSQIADIKAHLAASTQFRGIAPGLSAFASALAVGAAAAQTIWPQTLARDPLDYITVWAGVILVSFGVVTADAISRSRRLHGPMADAMLGAALRTILPFGAAGIVITAAICTFALESVWLLPGVWLILIGLLGMSALSSLPRSIVWAAAWYFLSGAVVLWLAGPSGVLTPWMMGVPLTVGQAIVALILHHGDEEIHGRG